MTHNDFSGASYGTVVQGQDITLSLPAAPPVAMAGLPAQSVFVGRERELGLLTDALRQAGSDQAVVVWSLGGLGGIGKTALAVRAAQHALREGWFPGGVVMVNLRGYDPPGERISASSALASLLGALGVVGQHIPAGLEDRARLWRSVLAEREKTLIVADNASSADQVRSLLPGTAEHRVVITSRHRLADLGGARLLDLDVLSPAEAMLVLADELSASDPEDRRLRDDPVSARAVVRLCAGLPLAVRIAAAFLVADPGRSLAEYAEGLAEDHKRLVELDYGGSFAVRATFDTSYRHLDASQARLFRLIALNPGPEIGIAAVAAAVGTDVSEVGRPVRELLRAHLLQPGSAPGRYRMHDLVHLYAAGEAACDEERDAAITRLLAHYRGSLASYCRTQDADDEMYGYFLNWGQALTWVDTERVNLVAGIGLAFTTGHFADVLEMTLLMFQYLEVRHHWDDLHSTHALAVEAARHLDDKARMSFILTNIGTAHRRVGRFDQAVSRYQDALAISRAGGDRLGEARALNFIGQVHRDMDMPAETIDSVQQALVIFRALGSRFLESSALHNLGVAHRLLGRHDEAIAYHLADMAICHDLEMRFEEGRVLDHLGLVYRDMGRFAEAVDHHRQNLVISREVGDETGEFRTLARLGVTYREWGRWDEAVACLREAVRYFDRIGDRYLQAGALVDLGLAHLRSGDEDEARRVWEDALEGYEALPGVGPETAAERVRALLDANA
ncbi:ATP-binding protein [Umezawaea sp. NPDC059074]|uniref:ATP-binding protein n=1 Tax=Umezawaea sp. NPDC059074 TaxID=3346716 RepID=UPI0036A330E1